MNNHAKKSWDQLSQAEKEAWWKKMEEEKVLIRERTARKIKEEREAVRTDCWRRP